MDTFKIYDVNMHLLHEGKARDFKTFVEQNKKHLNGANLSDANLEEANLEEANLRGANLTGTCLENANLKRTNLTNANLTGVNFSDANLSRANFEGTAFRNVNLPIFCKWLVTFSTKNITATIESISSDSIEITIGCKSKTIAEWDKWFAGTEEFATKRDTFEFKQIQGMYLAYKAYIEAVYGGDENE